MNTERKGKELYLGFPNEEVQVFSVIIGVYSGEESENFDGERLLMLTPTRVELLSS